MAKMGIIELLTRVGEDNIKFQNVAANMLNCSLSGKGAKQATKILFATDPAFITPTDIARGEYRYVGLVVWLPKERVDLAMMQPEVAEVSP